MIGNIWLFTRVKLIVRVAAWFVGRLHAEYSGLSKKHRQFIQKLKNLAPILGERLWPDAYCRCRIFIT